MAKKMGVIKITRLMFKNWRILLLIITFDILFAVFLTKVRFIQVNLDNTIYPLFAGTKISSIYSISYIIFELLLTILIYSFFKYFIIKFIEESFRNTELKLKDFFSFFKLNLVIFTPLIIIVAIILNSMIRYLGKIVSQERIDAFQFTSSFLVIGILCSIIFIYIYTFINILHFSFLKEKNLKKLIKRGIINSVRLHPYRIYWNDLKIVSVFAVILLIIHFLVKSFIFNDFSSYIKHYGNYKIFIISIIILIGYYILLLNRLNFYLLYSHKGLIKI